MLRLTLTIVPFGIETAIRHIGTLEISRTTAREDPEDYRVSAWDEHGELVNIFSVKQHVYADGAWELCRRAVEILTLPDLC